MTAPRCRIRAVAPNLPDRWVAIRDKRSGYALTNFASEAFVASRESCEAVIRQMAARRSHPNCSFHVEPAP